MVTFLLPRWRPDQGHHWDHFPPLNAERQPLIRDASTDDLPAIVEIYNASIPERSATADLEPVSIEARQSWFERHSPAQRPLWVLLRDGRVDAWLSFENFYGRPAYAATAEVSVYVRPQSRRQGLGQALLARAVEQAPQLGLSTLLAFVFSHNAASVALFERNQFEQWGHLPRVARLDDAVRGLLILGRHV
jgi:phosphinothricin acetyltransferase